MGIPFGKPYALFTFGGFGEGEMASPYRNEQHYINDESIWVKEY